MKRIDKLLTLLSRPKLIRLLFSMYFSGYLKDVGWFDSFERKEPVNENGALIPWATYSFISFISGRLGNVKNIFEFGSGGSTLFYSQYVDNVISVENNQDWYEIIKNKASDNVKILFFPVCDDQRYINSISDESLTFDMVIVDGRERVNCIKKSVAFLSDSGVLVLDDSERLKYKSGVDFLLMNGFKSIEFWGIAPGVFYNKCTTIFYKNNNVLGI